MPNNHLGRLLELLKPALDLGCKFEIYSDYGVIAIDLETQAKSGCVLKIEDDVVMAYRRYDRVDIINDFDDILLAVHGCGHGRDYFSLGWLNVFKSYGMSDPRGKSR